LLPWNFFAGILPPAKSLNDISYFVYELGITLPAAPLANVVGNIQTEEALHQTLPIYAWRRAAIAAVSIQP